MQGSSLLSKPVNVDEPHRLSRGCRQRYENVLVFYYAGVSLMATESEQLLPVREAARRCGRTPETVRRWIWDGKLPAQKLGNQLFIRLTDLDRMRGDDR